MKAAIITGASKGIGCALAKHLFKKGYHLLLVSRNEALLKSLKQELHLLNSNLIIQVAPCDVFNKNDFEKHINAFYEKTQMISLLINGAGYVKRGTSDVSDDALSEMIQTNLVGSINAVKAVLPFMKKNQSGYIVNLASRNAKKPRPFLGGYAATKAAILAYSESLYKELDGTGIKVTALCPGFVDTEMTSEVQADRKLLIPTADLCATIDYLLSLSPSTAIKEVSFESIVQVGKYC